MIELLSGIASATGLSTAAGLNAYLPLLIVGIAARYTDLVSLNPPFDALADGWVIAVLAVLVVLEMIVDKIPVADTVNDLIQTAARPLSGAVLFAAGSGIAGELHPAVAFIAGLLIAGGVHAAKTAARPAVTAATAGLGNWLISVLEDLLALVLVIVAILIPLLVLILIGTIILFMAGSTMGERTDT